MAGNKHDQDKPRVELIPPESILGPAVVFSFGARKYGDRNWEEGIAYSRLYAAAMRHLVAFFAGEDLDEESQLPHLDHALCCVMMLRATWARDESLELDDRPAGVVALPS